MSRSDGVMRRLIESSVRSLGVAVNGWMLSGGRLISRMLENVARVVVRACGCEELRVRPFALIRMPGSIDHRLIGFRIAYHIIMN